MRRKHSMQSKWGSWWSWFAPGLGIKRWIVLLAIGTIVFGIGIGSFLLYLSQEESLPAWLTNLLNIENVPTGLVIVIPLLLGGLLLAFAIVGLSSNLVAPYRKPGEPLTQAISQYKERSRGPAIVAIGGGTGLPSLLRGLTEYTNNITAIVTVADDGGSSGRIRRELGLIPPGDFRNNISALAKDEALMTQLMQYRFGGPIEGNDGQGALQGHAFGNLLLAALSGITGSFDEALVSVGKVLAMTGRVLPSTLSNVTLVAMISDQTKAQSIRGVGESSIPRLGGRIKSVDLEPADVPAYPLAVKAILNADLVAIGPGSLYTSIMPNILVPEIAQALVNTRAKRMYICNLATQPGETDNYGVVDHVEAIKRHVAVKAGDARACLDLVLANDNLSIDPATGGGDTVFIKPVPMEDLEMVTADLVDRKQPWRHDVQKLARTVIDLV